MDHKPLLQERLLAYKLEAIQGNYVCALHSYGATPASPRQSPTPTSSQGYPPATPGSTTSTAGLPPSTLPTPSMGSCPVCRVRGAKLELLMRVCVLLCMHCLDKHFNRKQGSRADN
uniref:Uncharacterized protein n=1 Tax=Piliocolobus tephrosceles TaxID=591936 RepID=A0A8C9ILU3_9PRIM